MEPQVLTHCPVDGTCTACDLNMRVTCAIGYAEHTPSGSEQEKAAYRLVSALEQRIAATRPAETLAGSLARLGAVTAAIESWDWLRATYLIESYMSDAPADLAEVLRELGQEAEKLQAAMSVDEPVVRPISFALRM